MLYVDGWEGPVNVNNTHTHTRLTTQHLTATYPLFLLLLQTFVWSQGHPSVPDTLRLKQVVVICRHGDRWVAGCRVAITHVVLNPLKVQSEIMWKTDGV